MPTYDVIVLGAGVMGSATAYHLARRGRRVLLLEQFGLGHERGSSHGHSRIFRLVYDALDYVRLAQAALPIWRQIEQESGAELLLQTGGLDFAEAGNQAIADTQAALTAAGVPFDDMGHDELARRFPQFALGPGMVGIYQSQSGILNATASVLALAEQARRLGAEVREHEPALAIAAAGAGVEVRTGQAAYRADRLVVTAGAWARPLLGQLGLDLPLTVTKEQVVFFQPHAPELFEPGRCPVFVHHLNGGPSVYGFPIFGLPGVKSAFHNAGPQVQPEGEDRAPEPERLEALHAHMRRWMPQAAGPIMQAQTCRYTSTPDHEFILDLHPSLPQVVVGSPCSGHGFKFGALFGAALADLAERGASEYALPRFGLGRFGIG